MYFGIQRSVFLKRDKIPRSDLQKIDKITVCLK